MQTLVPEWVEKGCVTKDTDTLRQTNYEGVLILITWDCHRHDHYYNKRDIEGGAI